MGSSGSCVVIEPVICIPADVDWGEYDYGTAVREGVSHSKLSPPLPPVDLLTLTLSPSPFL